MSESLVINATDETLEQELKNAKGPVLIDFWAQWCGPCKMLGPILDELSRETKGSLTIIKVDVEENPEAATEYQVTSIPTMVLVKDGQKLDSKNGLYPKQTIIDWVTEKAG